MINRHTALKEFVQAFFTENENLQFDFIDFMPGARTLVPDYGEFQIKQDIQGNKYKRYTFAFIAIQPYDTGVNEQNELNYQLFDDFKEWILKQQEEGNYPNFGKSVISYKWEVLQNMANLAFADVENMRAKYMLMCRLNYIEKGE